MVTVQLGYDANGNNTRLVDGDGNATVYMYTPWDQPESTIEPSTAADPNPTDRTWTTVYDAGGRVVQALLPGGVTRTETYDHLGRLTAETATGTPSATAARQLDYDALGRVVSVGSPAGNNTFTWSDRGLLVHATGYGGGATFGYDADGNQTSQQNAAGTATFGYDDAGRISSTVDPLTATTAHTSYDAAGRIEAIDLGSTHAGRSYTYDTLGRTVTDETTRPDGSVSLSTTYGYDLDELPTSKQTAGVVGAGADSYGYDGLGRLTGWTASGQTTSYGYDGASNRTTVTTSAGTRTSTFDARNRLISTTGAGQPADSYAWNSRGQLTNATIGGQSTTYTFDGFERLVQTAKSGGTTTTYGYDSLNRPAQRNGQNFGYTDLSDNAVISPAGAGETTLLRDPTGAALATRTGTDPARLIRGDAVHGDVVATVDPATGNPTASATYNPWGTPTNSTGTLPLGYQGGFTDPDSGLVAAQARWYNPETGSFASRDTLALPADPTPQTNRYLYGNASPLYLLDPSGHWPEWLKKAWGAVTDYTSWWWSSFQSGLNGEQPKVEAPPWVSKVNNWAPQPRYGPDRRHGSRHGRHLSGDAAHDPAPSVLGQHVRYLGRGEGSRRRARTAQLGWQRCPCRRRTQLRRRGAHA